MLLDLVLWVNFGENLYDEKYFDIVFGVLYVECFDGTRKIQCLQS